MDSITVEQLEQLLDFKKKEKQNYKMKIEKLQKKETDDSITYIKNNFFQLDSGVILVKDGLKMLDNSTFRQLYLNKQPKPAIAWWTTQNTDIYKLVVKPNAPFIEDKKINLFAGFKWKVGKYNKTKIQPILDFIKTVWTSDNEEQFNYIINWLANIAQGNKNESILYLKSNTEGIGKSTITQFLIKHVFGHASSIESDSEPLKSSYNSILADKALVVFEELETSNKSEWNAVSSRLKRWATSDDMVIQEKYMKATKTNNINNYIINTNHDSVKSSEGRRYFCLDLNTKYKNDFKFFNMLHQKLNDNTGKHFFRFLCSIDLSKYNSGNMPITQNKKIAMIERLNQVYKFIKFNYILDEKAINKVSSLELHDEYKNFCQNINEPVKFTKHKMLSLLKEVDIKFKSSNSKYTCSVTLEKLNEISEKFNWCSIHDHEEHSAYKKKLDDNYICDSVSKKDYDKLKLKYEKLLEKYNNLMSDNLN